MTQSRIESCDICSHKSKNMPDLNKHMSLVHKESDHIRIERLTKTFEARVSKQSVSKLFDCSECGDNFESGDQLSKHNARYHSIKSEDCNVKTKKIVEDKEAILTLTADLTEALMNIPLPDEDIHTIIKAEKESKDNLLLFVNSEFKTPSKIQENRGIKRNIEIETSSTTENIENTEYIKETFPNTDNTDNDDLQGITFKGKSRKYISAYNKLRENLIKDAEFKVNKNHLKVTATPKGKPMKVEVTKSDGEKGHAQIQMYKPGKKGLLY